MAFVLETKGLSGFILRIGSLIRRFDLSGNKMKETILQIEQLGKKYGYRPAIIIPALVLKRHHDLLNHRADANIEFAIHGYSHKNFKPLDLNQQVQEISKAKSVFEELQIYACGFRAPYLSWNGHTNQAVQSNGLLWESNETFIWNGFKKSSLSKLQQFMEKAIHTLYSPLDATKSVVIPRLQGEIVCIPIALPDDEILVDRLGISDPKTITKIWTEILESTHRRGDIFVLQLHPERFPICREPMEVLLDKALHSKRDIWITGMKEIAQWWKEKSQFEFAFEAAGGKGYYVRGKCTDRATILARNLPTPHQFPMCAERTSEFGGKLVRGSDVPFFQDYHIIKDRTFFIESKNLKPCIGVAPRSAEMLLKFLADEGFAYEVSDDDAGYSLFLSEYQTFGRENELDLLRTIGQTRNPIVRYWLWPDAKKSAFVTSHDLDCVTLTDFLLRLFGR